MSNYAAPPQLVEDVPYRDLDAMHAFARRWRDEHRGQWFSAAKLSGFCVLIKRAVYEAIGGLDERFGLGLFDDDDLAVRARQAGFELAVAHDLFVHHFGSRTFAGNGIDAGRLLEENARRFAAKWGHDGPVGAAGRIEAVGCRGRSERAIEDSQIRRFKSDSDDDRIGTTADRPSGRPGDRAVRRARVSLTMIVRDEEKNLPHCSESVRGVFDEIVVVDTGSVDRTREIAREYGAKVFEFAWIDDFAAARNAALEHATGDYAFWLDADDVIEPGQREKLIALLEGLEPGEMPARTEPRPPGGEMPARTEPRPPGEPESLALAGCRLGRSLALPSRGPAAYVVRCACDPGADGSGGETVVDHIRLFPLRPDVRWTYRVHEQILPALRRAGIPVRWTDLVVRHTGYADVALRARKLERDARILREELEDRPDEPFILFNLGAIAIERKDWTGALGYLRRSLRRSAPSDSITRKLFALIARAHQMLGDSAAALRVCAEGLALDPEDAELWFRKAVVHRHRGESAEAEACWRTDPGPDASRAVRQRGHGDLRAPHPAQPGGSGRRAGRRRGRGAALAGRARRMPRRPRGDGPGWSDRRTPCTNEGVGPRPYSTLRDVWRPCGVCGVCGVWRPGRPYSTLRDVWSSCGVCGVCGVWRAIRTPRVPGNDTRGRDRCRGRDWC